MRQLTFDEAFKPSADDIARGDGYGKQAIRPFKDYPDFGKFKVSKNITNLNDFMRSQCQIFIEKYNGESLQHETITNEELDYIRLLGSGSFATVALVRRKSTGIYYARKEVAKHYLVISKKIDEAKHEKKILDSLRFPFIMYLKGFYHDNISIYYLLPVMAGGELFNFLKDNRRLGERLTKFITAQVLLALEYIHYLSLIHRDIKLENILIDHFGYIKLSDFGLSKLIPSKRTYTICGTAEYMAPEVINHKGYGLAADWWSFGVLIYELCNGLSPFYANETIQVFNLISHCDYDMPVHFSNSLQVLIRNLLQPDLTKRIGNLQNGANDVKHQIWFREVPWLALINLRILSPMVPFISDQHDRKYFTAEPLVIADIPDIPDKTELYGSEFEDF